MDSIAQWFSDNLVIISFLLPLLIGLVVKARLPESVKALVMIAVNGIVVAVAMAESNAGVFSSEMLTEWVQGMVITVASYYGVWKPVGAGNIAPDKGIG